MSVTEELRALLDRRGVEYFKHEDGEPLRKLEKADDSVTSWRMGGASVCAVPIEGSELFDLWIDHCTPAQAIEATLGRGECEQVLTDCDDGLMPPFTARCSNCKTEWGHTPKFCPECGAQVTGTRDERKAVKR